jgi:hypothetical protein
MTRRILRTMGKRRGLIAAAALIIALAPLPARAVTLLGQLTITGPISVTTTPVYGFEDAYTAKDLAVQANFAYGSGGTSVDVYLQSSFDQGATWCDIAQFHFGTSSLRSVYNLSSLTPVTSQVTCTDGGMTANNAQDGLIGSQFRIKYKSSGTYAGSTTLQVDVISARLAPAPNR